MRKKQKKRIRLAAVIAVGIVAVALAAFLALQRQQMSNTEAFRLYVSEEMDFADLVDSLDAHNSIASHAMFGTLARLQQMPKRMHPGSYRIEPHSSMLFTIRRICIGSQDPVRVTINKHRTLPSFCQFLDEKLMVSAPTMMEYLTNDSVCDHYGLTPTTILCLFPQNTYEFYWTISPSALLDRMYDEYEHFWEPRQNKLQALGLSRQQVVTIASIVEEETNCNDEKADIASVYLNRYRIGMPLQADPTVKYAVGDFTIRRIRGEMLSIDSPYNTYRYAGLPPGPICIPSAASIDAVLQNKSTHYLYFCAKEDFSGRHNFASTIAEHQLNAMKFHKALNKRNIK